TYEEMLELAACGAKVLMLRCVEYARRYRMPIHVRSSYSNRPGTLVTGSMEELSVEQALITGVAHDRSEAKITIVGVPDEPGVAATFFAALADAGVNIEMISTSEIRVSVVCRDTDLDAAVRAVHEAFDLGGDEEAVVYAGTGR